MWRCDVEMFRCLPLYKPLPLVDPLGLVDIHLPADYMADVGDNRFPHNLPVGEGALASDNGLVVLKRK